MLEELNKAWGWKGFKATLIMAVNDFGNVLFKTEAGTYWRLCPEELTCEEIANDEQSLKKLLADREFAEDWNMTGLVEHAKQELGPLEDHQKYCLKMPALFGGEYALSNIGKISFSELIAASGDLAFQIKDLEDGTQIRIKTIGNSEDNSPN